MTTHWLADQGDFAVQASLMAGGYLAAAVLLSYLPASTRLHHTGRLAAALLIVIAALLPILSPPTLIIGAVAAVALWAISTTHSGLSIRLATGHLLALIPAAILIGLVRPSDAWLDFAGDNPAAAARIGVYLAAYALVTAPTGYAIAWLLNRVNLPSDHTLSLVGEGEGEGEVAHASHAGTKRRSPSPTLGRVIGILERLIMITLALLGQWQAAGLVIAAKSIARFRNLEDRDFAEYYLVGTLASLLAAFLIVAIALAIT